MRLHKTEMLIWVYDPKEEDEGDAMLKKLGIPVQKDDEQDNQQFKWKFVPFTVDLDKVTGFKENSFHKEDYGEDCIDVFFGTQYLTFRITPDKFTKLLENDK